MPSISSQHRLRMVITLTVLLALFLPGCKTHREAVLDSQDTQEVQAITIEELQVQDVGIIFEEPNLPHPEEIGDVPAQQTSSNDAQDSTTSKPRIAIIIDDMGFHKMLGQQLLDLPLNLTYSFLPHAPHTSAQEMKAYELGRDILVHLPMEAKDPTWDPGPNALYLKTALADIPAITNQLLDKVPHATGANNHMGSRFTEDQQHMQAVLKVLQQRQFFFIDSFTSSSSLAMEEATKLGIPAARRQVFLDNDHDQKKVCKQIEQLVAIAQKKGWAIGIGHPNKATLQALTHCQPDLLKQVELVGVHQLLSPTL